MRRALIFAAFSALLLAPCAAASEITVHVGPPSLGRGGSNPVSIPPVDILDYEFIYVSDNDFESNIALSPGLLFGQRSTTSGGIYVGFGGGLVLDSNGSGPGVYSSFGLDIGKTWRFNAEVKQALGFDFSRNHVLSPYALRVGVSYEL